MAPASYIWDQAQRTINDLNQATNTLAYYQNQLGSLDAYLGKFQDVAYYRSSARLADVSTLLSQLVWTSLRGDIQVDTHRVHHFRA